MAIGTRRLGRAWALGQAGAGLGSGWVRWGSFRLGLALGRFGSVGPGFKLGRGWGSGWVGSGLFRLGLALGWFGSVGPSSNWAGVRAGVGSGRARLGLGQVGLQALGWVGVSPSWVGPGFGQFWSVGSGLALGWL